MLPQLTLFSTQQKLHLQLESTRRFKENKSYWKRIRLESDDYSDEWTGTLTPPTERYGTLVWDFLASDDSLKKTYLTDGLDIA